MKKLNFRLTQNYDNLKSFESLNESKFNFPKSEF